MSFALYNPTRRIFRHRIRLEQNIYIAILSIIALILSENRVIVFGWGLVFMVQVAKLRIILYVFHH